MNSNKYETVAFDADNENQSDSGGASDENCNSKYGFCDCSMFPLGREGVHLITNIEPFRKYLSIPT